MKEYERVMHAVEIKKKKCEGSGTFTEQTCQKSYVMQVLILEKTTKIWEGFIVTDVLAFI